MCDNIQTEQLNEAIDDFISSLAIGDYSILFKRITSVRIKDIRILTAFSHFIKTVECGNSFSLAEMMKITEILANGGKIDENGGNEIYLYDPRKITDEKVAEKLMKVSLSNIISLFSLNNGIDLSGNVFSERLDNLQTKRFIILKTKKAERIKRFCLKNDVEIVHVGDIYPEDRVLIKAEVKVHLFNKNLLGRSNENIEIELTEEHFKSFMSGYNSVASLVLLDTVSKNNLFRLGLDGDIASVFARFLGFYVGVNDFKPKAYRYIYTNEQKFSVSVSKPSVSDGDYLYLLRLRDNQFEMTDKVHLSQLFYYLKDKVEAGVIKYALPYTKDIEATFEKLAEKNLEYVSFDYSKNDKFAIVVCVSRGESLNGTKIGYYKSIE